MNQQRISLLTAVEEAISQGARQENACALVGLSPRTLQRWRKQPSFGDDRRAGPHTPPAHRLSPSERATLLAVVNAPDFHSLSPKPIVPLLDDNPFSEALFRTMKYRPEYPSRPFDTLAKAEAWAEDVVWWYNREHLHSHLGYITPQERHELQSLSLQENRRFVYEQAKAKHPARWGGMCRPWNFPDTVTLHRPLPPTAPSLSAERRPPKKASNRRTKARLVSTLKPLPHSERQQP